MDLLGPIQKAKRGNQHVMVIAYRYYKLKRTVPTEITASIMETVFIDYWVSPYGIKN